MTILLFTQPQVILNIGSLAKHPSCSLPFHTSRWRLGVCQALYGKEQLGHYGTHLILCSTEEGKLYRFEMPRGEYMFLEVLELSL